MDTRYADTCNHQEDGTPCLECQELDAAFQWYISRTRITQHISDPNIKHKILYRSLRDTQSMLRHHQRRANSN